MKKTIFYLMVLHVFVLSFPLQAKTTWNLQGVVYEVDTLRHYQVGPGTTLTVVDLSGPVKLRVFYTVTDLTNPNVEIKSICGNNELKTSYTVPDMVINHANDGNVYFAGVNSDLFSTLGPIGTTIVDGEIYKVAKTSTGWFQVGVDGNKNFYYGQPYTTYKLNSTPTGQMSPKGVNVARASNDFIIYTSKFGSGTGTTVGATGVEVGAIEMDGGLKADGVTRMKVVTAPQTNIGNMTIPENGFVLSANASWYMTPLQNLSVGDVIEITPTFTLNGATMTGLIQMSGGCPVILSNGIILNNDGLLDHLTLRRPRTSIGTDATGTKMILLVVDGDTANQDVSAGCTSKDLAAIMLAVGCTNALNFDGGGSSTMYTKPFGVENVPSESGGGLRKVRSGWFVTTADKGDTELKTIAFADYAKNLLINEEYAPVIYGYNEVGLLINTNLADFTLSCSNPQCNISADGKKITFTQSGTYLLTATSGAMTTNIMVNSKNTSGINNVETDFNCKLVHNVINRSESAQLITTSDINVKIFSINGTYEAQVKCRGAAIHNLPTSSLLPGVYLVNAGDKTMKLIIK